MRLVIEGWWVELLLLAFSDANGKKGKARKP